VGVSFAHLVGTVINPPQIARILGGPRTLKRTVSSIEDLREVVEAGLPVASLRRVVRRVAGVGVDESELTHRLVPRTTLQRRKGKLSPRESEHVERLARMTALAEHVWEDADLAHEFLTSPQPQLGGRRPVELASSDLGTRQVESLLMKLEYSLPV